MVTEREQKEFPGIKRKSKENKQIDKFDAFNEISLNSKIGLFEKSPSSTVKDLQRKLDQIGSPSDSKNSSSEEESENSLIPPAH